MSDGRDEIRRAEALAWHLRLSDGSADDWEAFTAWLEQSPENSSAYDALALADDRIGEALALAPARPAITNDNDRPPPGEARKPVRRRVALGVATAAAATVAGLFAYPMLSPDQARYAIETPEGRQRSIRLKDGTRIDLNGGTRILLSRKQPRFALLEQGEATFSVKHDPSDPFVVESGDARIQDIGTVFNVVQDGGRLELAVAEGSVLYNPDKEAIQLAAGSSLRTAADQDRIIVGSIHPDAVAGWRDGRLVYDGASLGAISRDMSRALGTQVEVSPEIAAQRFTGVIVIDRNQPIFFKRLEGLLNVQAHHTATGWRLSP